MVSLFGRHIRLGRSGEDLAEEFFLKQGCTIADKNFRTRFGELDLVLENGEEIIFVEVKTRRAHGFGRPEEAVTPDKQARIRRCAESWLMERGLLESGRPLRFDVLAITMEGDGKPSYRHIPYAF